MSERGEALLLETTHAGDRQQHVDQKRACERPARRDRLPDALRLFGIEISA
jgi:hypothetical protein